MERFPTSPKVSSRRLQSLCRRLRSQSGPRGPLLHDVAKRSRCPQKSASDVKKICPAEPAREMESELLPGCISQPDASIDIVVRLRSPGPPALRKTGSDSSGPFLGGGLNRRVVLDDRKFRKAGSFSRNAGSSGFLRQLPQSLAASASSWLPSGQPGRFPQRVGPPVLMSSSLISVICFSHCNVAKNNYDEERLVPPGTATRTLLRAPIVQAAKPGMSHRNYAFPRYAERTRQKPIARLSLRSLRRRRSKGITATERCFAPS